ncbi:MAG: hypothetical protein AAGC47_07645 [Bacteroidota bacterium]
MATADGPFQVDEGSASISNQSGDLLFSTNGANVYNRNGNIMPNGTGLSGDFSSTQNAVIIPQPGDSEERFYYVFTISSQSIVGENFGLDATLVDMSLNGGLGDVTLHFDLLMTDVYEKIHAVMHANE